MPKLESLAIVNVEQKAIENKIEERYPVYVKITEE